MVTARFPSPSSTHSRSHSLSFITQNMLPEGAPSPVQLL